MRTYDAAVVGAGPNGLAAAIRLAQAGRSVVVLEASPTIGGGARTAELTLPGFHHDVCSAIHPMAAASPFFQALPLADNGVDWIQPTAACAHPLDDGPAAVLVRSVEETAFGLGEDEERYLARVGPFVRRWPELVGDALAPLGRPRHPLLMARFGLAGVRSADALARRWFRGERARALFAGLAAHSLLPLERAPSAAIGLMLGLAAHGGGWPLPRGGSQRIVDALAAILTGLGGEIVTEHEVRRLDEVPTSGAVLFDLSPRNVARIARDELPGWYRGKLERFRHGPGSFKLDLALDGPIPWRDPACARAGTVHLGGTFAEVAAGERAVWEGRPAERPFVLVAQQSLFDPTRAPAGKHTAWAYCHVPHGSAIDASEAIEAQIERFAPGFRDLVLARHARSAVELERYDANYVGGDIGGGANTLEQLFTRPTARLVPYATPNPRLFFCSASTPPGGGVHGMCGYHAAEAVITAGVDPR